MHSSTTKNFLAPYVKSTEVEKLCFQLAWEFRDQVCGVFCSFTGAFEERVEQMVTDLPGTMLNALYTLLHHFTLRRVILPWFYLYWGKLICKGLEYVHSQGPSRDFKAALQTSRVASPFSCLNPLILRLSEKHVNGLMLKTRHTAENAGTGNRETSQLPFPPESPKHLGSLSTPPRLWKNCGIQGGHFKKKKLFSLLYKSYRPLYII